MDPYFRKEINILIIDDNNAPFILPLIRSFSGYKNINLDVLVISHEKPHLFRYSRYIRHLYYKKGNIQEQFEEGVRETIEQSAAHLIIPTREWISRLIAEHHHWLNDIVRIHPVSDVDTIELTFDKWKLNQWLKANQFPYSMALPVSKKLLDEFKPDEFPFPALLKPLEGAGGIGIKLVDDAKEMIQVLSRDENYLNGFFIQEYIQGYDIDMSLFSMDGKILFHTIQRGMMGGSFEFPKGIEFIKNGELFDLVTDIIEKLRFTGIAHLDFRYDSTRKVYILIDFNARYWSSLQGSRLMGVNFPVLATAYTFDIPFEFPDYSTGYFYYGTAAIKRVLKNFSSGSKYPVQIRNTQIYSIARDPLPEILYLIKRLVKINS